MDFADWTGADWTGAAWTGAVFYAVLCGIGLRTAKRLEHAARALAPRA
jgi:hypothetical protein